jgi:hypothetical protein
MWRIKRTSDDKDLQISVGADPQAARQGCRATGKTFERAEIQGWLWPQLLSIPNQGEAMSVESEKKNEDFRKWKEDLKAREPKEKPGTITRPLLRAAVESLKSSGPRGEK